MNICKRVCQFCWGVVGLLVIATPLFAQTPVIPLDKDYIVLSAPTKWALTENDEVTFRGKLSQKVSLFTINGQRVIVGKGGQFVASFPLSSFGENSFEFKVEQNGNPIIVGRRIVVRDFKSPQITLFSPQENTVTSKPLVFVKGEAKGARKVYVDGKRVMLEASGRFQTKVKLTEKNAYKRFRITAISPRNRRKTIERRVFYKATPVIPNIVLKTAHANKLSVTYLPKYEIVGSVTHAKSLRINNKPVTFRKDGVFRHKLRFKTLNERQELTLVAVSESGHRAEMTAKVAYVLPPDKVPGIEILSPEPNFISRRDSVLLKGKAKNATSVQIGDERIAIDKDGRFSTRLTLADTGKYQAFDVLASNPHTSVKKRLRVFYQPNKKRSGIPPKKRTVTGVSRVNGVARSVSPNALAGESRRPDPVPERRSSQTHSRLSSAKVPQIILDSPENNFVTYKDAVVFKGRVENTEELFVNSRAVKLDKRGQFMETFSLEGQDRYVFNLVALGRHNLSNSLIRKIYRVKSEKTPSGKVASSVAKTTRAMTLEDGLARLITLELASADIQDVLKILSKKSGLNIISDTALSGEVSIFLKDITVQNAIEFILDTQGLSYKIVGNTILVAAEEKLEAPTKLATRVIKLNNIGAKDASDILKTYLSSQESIQSVAQDNTVILRADPQKIEELVVLSDQLDSHETPQVYLEVQVIETSVSALEGYGISWPRTVGFGVEASITAEKTTIQSNPSITAIINLLEEKGEAKVLASPRLKAVHDEQAAIFIGDKIPVVETTVDTTGRISESVSFVDTGIQLSVLPAINTRKKEIKIKIQPEVSIISGFRGANNDKPVIKTRKVDTTVWVKDGETVVIGGLFNSSDTDSNTQLPILGDLPLFGNLFSSKKVDQAETELIITVTPRIVGRGRMTIPVNKLSDALPIK